MHGLRTLLHPFFLMGQRPQGEEGHEGPAMDIFLCVGGRKEMGVKDGSRGYPKFCYGYPKFFFGKKKISCHLRHKKISFLGCLQAVNSNVE